MPFLSVEKRKGTDSIGFLHIDPSRKLEIGAVTGPEYKLVQCLFSPFNFPSARYNSVFQTQDRVLDAIQRGVELERHGTSRPSDLHTMRSAIRRSIARLEEREIGKFLDFAIQDGKVRMTVDQSSR